MTRWDLNAWYGCDGSILYFFDFNRSSHNSRGVGWLLWHSKLTTLYTVSYEIKYTTARLSCVHSKIQQLCLIRYALDIGDTCWDELLAAWFLHVQQILLKTTDTCLVLARSKPLMTTSTTNTCIFDRTRRSNRGQRPVTRSDLHLFCLGCRWHRRTVRTLRADTPPVEFLTLAPKTSPPLIKCANHQVYPLVHMC